MARLQWCRKHIDEVAEACDLSRQSVDEVKQAATFCDEHADFSALPTKPIIALIRVRDEQVRERAIIKCSERLNGKIGAGRGNTKELTERDIKKIIERSELEVRKELMEQIRDERESAIVQEVVPGDTNTQTQPIEQQPSEQEPEKENPVGEGNEVKTPQEDKQMEIAITTLTRREIDFYFDIMKKILCEEDIPKHKKRIEMMIENKTLLVTR